MLPLHGATTPPPPPKKKSVCRAQYLAQICNDPQRVCNHEGPPWKRPMAAVYVFPSEALPQGVKKKKKKKTSRLLGKPPPYLQF